tara:strand:- start:310 stop:1074 length:765 start_codon:yes stop_codon:yes gene_type:complete
MASRIKISRRKEYKEQIRAYLNFSKNLNAKLKRLFRKVKRKASVKYINGMFIEDIMFLEFGEELYKMLSNHYRLVIGSTANRLIKIRTKQDQETEQLIDKFLRENLAQKVSQISETTRALLATTIATGIADGLGVVDMGKLIQKSVAFADYRATMISRTETHTSLNYASMLVSKVLQFQNPKKVWVSALDDRTRTWHFNMDGKKVEENEMFKVSTPKVGIVLMEYCGDPRGGARNVINCRCMTQTYDEEDEILA